MQALSQLSYSPRKEAHTIGIWLLAVNTIFEKILAAGGIGWRLSGGLLSGIFDKLLMSWANSLVNRLCGGGYLMISLEYAINWGLVIGQIWLF